MFHYNPLDSSFGYYRSLNWRRRDHPVTFNCGYLQDSFYFRAKIGEMADMIGIVCAPGTDPEPLRGQGPEAERAAGDTERERERERDSSIP
jgi:hypothetical protein